MGLMSKITGRGKKKEEAERARQAEEAEKIRQQQLEQQKKLEEEAEQREREKRQAKHKKQQANQDLVGENIAVKRKEIEQLQNAIARFEKDVKKQMEDGREAKKLGKTREALRYAQTAKRTKVRITNYENQLKLLEDQLFALEDTAANLNMVDQVNDTTEALTKLNEEIDPEKVDDVLVNAREEVAKTQAVQDTFQADAQLHGMHEDEEDLLNELEDESFGPIGTEANVEHIPDVPVQKPQHPGRLDEDAEFERLENSMKTGPGGSSSRVNAQVQSVTSKLEKVTTKTQEEIEEEELRELEMDLQ